MRRKAFLLLASCLLIFVVTYAQDNKKYTRNVGFDPITQGFYYGFDRRVNNYSFGVDLGSSLDILVPLSVSLCVDNALYFGKANKYNLKTWHINGRVAYSKVLVSRQENLLCLVLN